MNSRRVGVVGALLLLAGLVGLIGYWWASPLLAIRAMQSAAQRGDAAAFSEHVDYPRLRESVKAELARQMTARLGGASHHGDDFARAGAAFGAAIGLAMADRVVDALVQPELVMRAMQEGKLLPRSGGSAPAPDGTSQSSGRPKVRWEAHREGLDRYVAYARRDGDRPDQRIVIVLERSAFATWRLTDIRLPAP